MSATTDIATSGATGALAGTAIAPGVGTAIGAGLGIAGGALNYAGGRRAARQQARALHRWQRRRQDILNSLLQGQWATSGQQQGLLTDEINAMPTDAAATVHNAGEFAAPDATAAMDPDQRAAYLAALGQGTEVGDAQLAAGGENQRRANWLQALGENADQTNVRAVLPRNQLRRQKFTSQLALDKNDQRYAKFVPSNSTANMQLLGSLLSSGGNAAIQYSARG